jgi:hypothetical protein
MVCCEKSAEVIVVDGKRADTFGVKSEYSQVDEGLNIKSVGIQDGIVAR